MSTEPNAAQVRLDLQFLGERGGAWWLATASVPGFVPKSLVVADAGTFEAAQRVHAGGGTPIVRVTMPRWRALQAGFLTEAGEGQGELL